MTSRKAKKTAGVQPDVQPIELGTVTTWPLDQLAISNLNVRKHGGLDGVDELAIDIEAKGLLQSLIVHPGPAGPEDKGRLVAGGQRRYLALCRLAKAGKIAADAPIAVRDVPEDVAIEASLSENIQRKDMTPADEFRAFKALIETGRYNAQQIADRFGFKKAHVARRLRLAELIPEILEALEAGKFGIESAMAYAAAATPEQQLKIFKAQERSNYDKHKPASILSSINTGGIDADSNMGKFLGGAKAYEQLGGSFEVTVMDDLFAKHGYSGRRARVMRDGTIVAKLWATATEKASKALLKQAEKKFGGIAISGVLFPPSPAKSDALPKPPAEYFKATLQQYSYYGAAGNDLTEGEFKNFLKKVKKEGGRAFAIASFNYHAQPGLHERTLFVSADMKDHYKKFIDDRAKVSQRQQAENENERKRKSVSIHAAMLFWRTLSPEQKIARMSIRRQWPEESHVRFELAADVDKAELDPFMAEAEAQLVESARLAAEAEATEEARAGAAAAEREAVLAAFELKPIEEWPAQVTIGLPDHAVSYEIQRVTEDGKTLLHSFGPEGDDWESDNVLETVQLIRDAVAGHEWTIEIIDELPAEEAPANGQGGNIYTECRASDLPEQVEDQAEGAEAEQEIASAE